jgi:hypothetical protein
MPAFYPATGSGWRFLRSRGFRAAQLRLEDSQRTADGMTAHIHGPARFGKANQRHQNVVQAERQQ